LIPNPIHKVLSILHSCGARYLLMGGQACILYGAAEFSRDTDIVILAEASNLKRLRRALSKLRAECIAVPPLSLKWLHKGHAVHFRCHLPGVENVRLDIMAKLRNAPSFKELWRRRTTIAVASGESYDLISLPDLVQIKKTQRDKDWLMLRRLVEAHYFSRPRKPDPRKLYFWLQEMRTPEILVDLAKRYPKQTSRAARRRSLLLHALQDDALGLEVALKKDEETERTADRLYWAPMKKELEHLRHKRQYE
jgi:hypothetical protein